MTKEIKINLKGSLEDVNTPSYFNGYLEDRDTIFKIDLSEISFVKPSGLSILYNIVRWLEDNENYIEFILPDLNNNNHKESPIRYLDDSKFFDKTIGYKVFDNSHLRETTLELTNISISQSNEWFLRTFNPWIAKHIGCNPNRLSNLEMLLQELINNTKDHSTKDFSYIYAQYYPKNREIEISIGDTGVGIPNNVKQKVPHLQYDWQRIAEAMNRGFTTKTNAHNMGEGLYILKKYILDQKLGRVSIISGTGHYVLYPSGREFSEVLNYNYPGTYISIVINIETIGNILTDEYIDGGVELEW
ncbi:ATP-binding protein [Staphylococcus agnetis]|uniref:ATP-binding protein n=1 Tax=Staphylococcus agnetis TaxID=985762 RepID=UPI0004E344AC|nr:ATP-binding protein [Staphylococcus agnetis]KFE42807.1 putative CheA signal transduction histidine kinase [Staphylococcus agnetis]PTH46415.1 ATP-binding protein [Staphylococcus agnetis]